jgi:hypothetical protein
MKAVSSSYERRKQDSPTLALCYNPASFFRQSGENTVNRHVTVGLVMIASAALGAAAVQTLHAQAKPPAYNIVEITIKDQDGYNKGDKYATQRIFGVEGVSP